ncbi:MAG: alpha-L-arabinofuranosidase C-terminal domain-containing protein, partial [Bacteroidota bacterium]
EGYWGVPIRPSTAYQLSLWVKSEGTRPISISLESENGVSVFAKAEIKEDCREWKKVAATLRTGKNFKSTGAGRLVIRSGDQTIWLSEVSLFPPTFKNRVNGNRPDLMKMLADMKPKFLRFPGGNYLEGNKLSERFNWKETVGPVDSRPGHRSPWGYRSTDGVGLLEFLLWCEETKAKPLLGVFAGYTLDGKSIPAGPGLKPYVDEALEEIEYVTGGPETKWGAQRVKDGHPKPFPLEWVEIGNEDGFDKSGSYEGRFVQFYDAIKAKYPKIKVISSTGGKDFLGLKFPITQRRPDLWDEHYYTEAWDMMGMATHYDNYDRTGPKVFVGEWAAHDKVAPWVAGAKAGPTPNMRCTLADAAFMTGLERNSDIVEMACYAPLLVNVNPGGRQWSLNLIGYDNLNSFGSPSYYAQKMFAESLGDRTVHTALSDVPMQMQGEKKQPGIFTSVTRDSKSGRVYVKLVNAIETPVEIVFDLKGGSFLDSGTWTVLSGDLAAVNTLAEPRKVAPVTRKLEGVNRVTLPAHSVSVLSLQLASR